MMKWIVIMLLVALPGIYFLNRGGASPATDITVVTKWDVPEILREISGIAWMSDNRFACIQDEEGIIYIYNTITAKVEKEIPFAAPGDFEGLTLVGNIAYAMRSDGRIFEINNINSNTPVVAEYHTHLVAANNVEGLTFDKANNRLLAVIKGPELTENAYKGIYAFDLATKTMSPKPVYKISLTDIAFKGIKVKKANKIIQPSEIAVHPRSGDIFITDAIGPRLITLNKNGITAVYNLTLAEFSQAEGMTFSPSGKLFIANEGRSQPGNILEVRLKN